jgi:putative transposase
MKVMIQKTFTYCLKPTETQKALFQQFSGASRYVYNWALNLVKESLDAQEGLLSYKDIANLLTQKKTNELWLKEIHSQVLQQALKDLERSLNNCFSGKKRKAIGFPGFRCRGVKDSFRFPQYIKCVNARVFLPKIGWVAYRNSRPLEGMIKQATVKRQGKRWFIHIMCQVELDIEKKPFTEATAVGIDVGIKELSVLSNGKVYENPHFLKSDLGKLAYVQKAHARKQKGSKNRKKSAKKIGRVHAKIANKRKDYIHKISTEIVESQDTIIVEKLQISGMIRNRKLSRSIADVSWRILLTFLKYKAAWRGKNFIEIPQFTPTSKTCFVCKIEKAMPLSLRKYVCANCGHEMDRDLNAALNIKAAGTAVLACGGMDRSPLYEAGITGF